MPPLKANFADEDVRSYATAAAAALDGAFSDRARAFVEAGDELVAAVSIIGELTQAFDNLPKALSSPELVAASTTLQLVAAACSTLHDIIPNQLKTLRGLSCINESVGIQLDRLSTNIELIGMLSVNARIEASGLKSASQNMSAFTHDVARLATTAGQTVDQYASAQNIALRDIGRAQELLAMFEMRHLGRLTRIEGELRQNIVALDERRHVAVHEAGSIGERSRRIAASVGKLISALQVADITSQRLAHVHESIELVAQGLADGGDTPADAWWSGLSLKERHSVAAQVATLQLAQIEDATAELMRETQTINTTLAELSRDAVAMGQQGAALYGPDNASSGSFIDDLSARLNLACDLLSECERARAAIADLNGKLGDSIGSLHDRSASLKGIVSIVTNFRIIGLNAYLSSHRLGVEGHTLSVISRELRDTAEVISSVVSELAQSMHETSALFKDLNSHGATLDDQIDGSLDDQMLSAVSAFQESGRDLAEAVALLNSDGQKVRDLLDRTAQRLGAADGLEDRLTTTIDRLRDLCRSVDEPVENALIADRIAAHFKHRYTMVSERQVHAGRGTNADATRSTPSSDDLSDILF